MFGLLLGSVQKVCEAYGLKKAKTFMTSYVQFFPHSAHWLRFVDGLYRFHVGEAPPVEMIRSKFLRGYYSRKLTPTRRLALLTSHYDVVESYFRQDIVAKILSGTPLLLSTLCGKSGETYSLSLCHDEWFRFEGELTVFLHRDSDQQVLSAVTFTMQFTPRRQIVIRIGGLQGPSCAGAKDMVVQATKDLSGARPKSVVVDGLFAIAGMLGATQIEAVNLGNHPLKDVNHRLVADNDAFWEEMATGRAASGEYTLPVSRPSRRLEDVAAKKRKDWLVRERMKAEARTAIRHRVRSWMRYLEDAEEVTTALAIAAE